MTWSTSEPGTKLREPHGSLARRIAGTLLVAPLGLLILSLFLGFRAALIIAVLAVIALGLFAMDSLIAMFGWEPPVLQISSAPYPLGVTTTVVYRRKPKRVIDIAACRVECLLVCEERATYTRGSDTTTETRRVYESSSVGQGEGTAQGLRAELDLDITAHLGSPSFKLPNNEVRWFVEVSVVGPRLPKDDHTFIIDVAAVLDQSLRVGVQDT